MSYNFSTKEARIRQQVKMHAYKYSIVFHNTYPGFFGRIGCLEECWQFQRLVKVIEYFTTSSDCFRVSHCIWRQSGGILRTFISEDRMLPMLERLDPTAHKGEYHVISSNSFAFQLCNDSTCWPPGPILDQFSWTWGCQELFLEVEIQSSRRETRISSIQFHYPLDHKLSTRPESQDKILVHIRQQHEDQWHLEWAQG